MDLGRFSVGPAEDKPCPPRLESHHSDPSMGPHLVDQGIRS
jgi:hypothetical protein